MKNPPAPPVSIGDKLTLYMQPVVKPWQFWRSRAPMLVAFHATPLPGGDRVMMLG